MSAATLDDPFVSWSFFYSPNNRTRTNLERGFKIKSTFLHLNFLLCSAQMYFGIGQMINNFLKNENKKTVLNTEGLASTVP